MWQERYVLGVERIDTQHKELFRMTDELLQAIHAQVGQESLQKAIGFLKQYVVYHFQDEEAYQASIGYSGIAAHKREHQAFTDTVLDYEKRLAASGYSLQLVKDLAGTLTAWLIYHVADTDQKMVHGESALTAAADSFMGCLVGSTLEVLQAMADLPTAAVVRHPANPSRLQGDVFVELGLLGSAKGRAVFGFSQAMAFELLRIMTFTEPQEVDELVRSALAELVNIAGGNASTLFSRQAGPCDIQPPVVQLHPPAGLEDAQAVLLDTPAGRLTLAVQAAP